MSEEKSFIPALTLEPNAAQTAAAVEEAPVEKEKKDEQKAEEAKEETPAEAEQEEAAEKDLNEMTADELFAYLMTVSGDDMDALYEKYPNLDELTAAFSEEQMQELTAHFGGDQVAELDITGASQVKVGESVTLTGTKSDNRNSDHSTLYKFPRCLHGYLHLFHLPCRHGS